MLLAFRFHEPVNAGLHSQRQASRRRRWFKGAFTHCPAGVLITAAGRWNQGSQPRLVSDVAAGRAMRRDRHPAATGFEPSRQLLERCRGSPLVGFSRRAFEPCCQSSAYQFPQLFQSSLRGKCGASSPLILPITSRQNDMRLFSSAICRVYVHYTVHSHLVTVHGIRN